MLNHGMEVRCFPLAAAVERRNNLYMQSVSYRTSAYIHRINPVIRTTKRWANKSYASCYVLPTFLIYNKCLRIYLKKLTELLPLLPLGHREAALVSLTRVLPPPLLHINLLPPLLHSAHHTLRAPLKNQFNAPRTRGIGRPVIGMGVHYSPHKKGGPAHSAPPHVCSVVERSGEERRGGGKVKV